MPAAFLRSLDLPEPSLSDNRSHERRIRETLASDLKLPVTEIFLPLQIARQLPGLIREHGYRVDLVFCRDRHGYIVSGVFPKGCSPGVFGLAVDLGSTSVVFYLVDLRARRVVETVSRHNPQASHGDDILDRIIFASRGNGLQLMQQETAGLFNEVMADLCGRAGIRQDDIYYCSVAGNTTMCHLLLGLDPWHICREPYLPVVNRFDLISPEEVGLEMNPLGRLYLFPNIGSYFGGDLISGIIASGLHRQEEISLLVDVGTNAEVILGNRDWLVACAGAAGPALEGGILSCGTRAQPGAIERVEIDPTTLDLSWQTIGEIPPVGLCGSGIIDLLAALFLAGLVDSTGKLVVERDPDRFRKIDDVWCYVVADESITGHGRPVYISQSDIKNLIRSKGAMYTILNVVVQSVGVQFSDIQNFYVAGAFGTYISPDKAITIGMLPDISIDRFKGLGNAAGEGAVNMLLDASKMDEANEICDRITYLEMNVRGDFMDQLTGALFLPHTDLSLFPSVAAKLKKLGRFSTP